MVEKQKKQVLFQVGHDCRTFAVVVHEANAHDNVGADGVIDKMKGCFPRLKKMLADGGYKGRKLADTVRQCLSLKKVDSQQRVNNGVFTHPETVQLL